MNDENSHKYESNHYFHKSLSVYNGPQEIDHLFQMNREHGKINQRKRKKSILSSLYTKPAAPDEEKRLMLEMLMARLDYWNTMLPALGNRKLTVKLQEEGYRVGRKLVRRLMREMGIWVVYPKPNLSKRNFQETIVPYLLRNKVVSIPNQVWSIDITYIKLNRSHMYLTAIIDWCSRKIVGWNLSDTLGLQPVLEAVRSAVDRFGTPSILNSDQGSQFTSNEYKQLLKGLHIRQSMDGKSRWADNIMIERWFRNLKTELVYINEFRPPGTAAVDPKLHR